MSSVEVYQEEPEAGTTKTLSKFTPSATDAISFPVGIGLVGGVATFGVNVIANNHDPFTLLMSMAAAIGIAGYASSKTTAHQAFKYDMFKSITNLRANYYVSPRFGSVRRTREEKRLVIVENAPSVTSPDSRVTLTMVTNKEGVWIEESVKVSPKKSWDKVLDSLIKVHGLESIDALASVTVPEVIKDGQKVPWMDRMGALLSEVGFLKECQKRDCATNCRHLF